MTTRNSSAVLSLGRHRSHPGPITISIAMFGAVPHGKMLRRAGAQPGDRVVVTGTIGDAALGSRSGVPG